MLPGKNNLDWSQDIQNHLDSQGLLDVIYDVNNREVEVTCEMNAKEMILFRRHISSLHEIGVCGYQLTKRAVGQL